MSRVAGKTGSRNAGMPVLFQLGFRPFFLSAGLIAIISMAVWMAKLVFAAEILPAGILPMHWHAHEMIYGYALAVIAGFLLTAVRNWTGIQTIHGRPLQLLLLLVSGADCLTDVRPIRPDCRNIVGQFISHLSVRGAYRADCSCKTVEEYGCNIQGLFSTSRQHHVFPRSARQLSGWGAYWHLYRFVYDPLSDSCVVTQGYADVY